MTVAGFRGQQEVALGSFTFSPLTVNATDAQMVQAVLPSVFVLLQNVTMVQDEPFSKLLAVDDIVFTTHS